MPARSHRHALRSASSLPRLAVRAGSARAGRATVLAVLTTLAALGILVAAAPAADAHQPVFVDDSTPAASAPVLDDGTISFAVYGTITAPDRVAIVNARLRAGDPLWAELLIPALEPESGLAPGDLPRFTVVAPDGVRTEVASAIGERFDEPFSKTSYLRLGNLTGTAIDGTYTFEVRAARPSRFTLAVGLKETGGPVSQYAGAPPDALPTWYATAPPATPAATTPPATTSAGAAATQEAGPGAAPTTGSTSDSTATPLALLVVVGVVVLAVLATAVVVRQRRRSVASPPS